MPRQKTTTIASPPATEQETKKKPRRTNGEGSVRERGDGRFEARVSLPDGKRQSIYGETRKEVVAKARALQQQIEQGTYVSPSRETVAEHLRQWITMKRLVWGDSTYVNASVFVEKHIIPALGDTKLQILQKKHIQAFYTDLSTKKGLAPSTIHQIHGTFRAALEHAVEEQKVVVNPARRLALPRREKKEMRYLTIQEIERVIEAANDHQQGCLYLLAVVTGMRHNELLALKWEDIDLEQGIIQVKRSLGYYSVDHSGSTYKEGSPKSKSSRRRISLPALAIAALQHHRTRQREIRLGAEEWHDLGLVFPNRQGLHQSPPAMYRTYKRFLQRVGIADAHFHATRHGHATSLLEMGENPRVVQERLGHSQVSTTLGVYGHVTPTIQQQTIAKLDARFGKVYQATTGV